MNWKITSIIAIVIIVAASIGYFGFFGTNSGQKTELSETGSTLFYPVFTALWINMFIL